MPMFSFSFFFLGNFHTVVVKLDIPSITFLNVALSSRPLKLNSFLELLEIRDHHNAKKQKDKDKKQRSYGSRRTHFPDP